MTVKTPDEVRQFADKLRYRLACLPICNEGISVSEFANLLTGIGECFAILCQQERADLARSIHRYAAEMVIRCEADKCPAAEVITREVCE